MAYWLESHDYAPDTIEIMEKNAIDGKTLLKQGNTSLLALGINRLGERKRLLRDIKNLLALSTYGWLEKGWSLFFIHHSHCRTNLEVVALQI